jgi:hypothetical protein
VGLRGRHGTPRVYATRGYAIRARGRGRVRVRGRHSCTWTPCVDDTAHHACTSLAGMQPEYTHEYGYVDTTRVRGYHTCTSRGHPSTRTWTPCVDDTAHHACTPLAGTQTPEYVYGDTTRVRSHYACTSSPRCVCLRYDTKLRYDTQHTTRCAQVVLQHEVELQHGATATYASWNCSMEQQPHTQGVRMPLAGGERGGGMSSGNEAGASSVRHSPEGVELQHGAAATYARRAYATRRRRRWRHPCTCTPLEHVAHVKLRYHTQHTTQRA